MAKNFKQINLVFQDPVDHAPLDLGNHKSLDDISTISKMLQVDMFFLILGKPSNQPQDEKEFLYFTKNKLIRNEYKIHTQTIYIDKFDREGGDKKIVSLGRDENEQQIEAAKGWILKVWDFSCFV